MHKIAFEIGGLHVHWYGIFAVTGFVLGFWTAGKRAVKEGISAEAIADLSTWIILSAIAGARINYVITFWRDEFAGRPLWEAFKFYQGGLVYFGGFIGASLGVCVFAWLKKIPLWKLADVMAPSVALGHVFGRIGCLMTGCCYGRPASVPWAIHFPKDHETGGVGVHPTQIYESLLNLCLYFALALIFRRKRFDGQVFASYLMGYGLVRGFVECFRGDYAVRYFGGMISQAQLISGIIFVIGVALWLWADRKPKVVESRL